MLTHFTCISKHDIPIIFLLYKTVQQTRVSLQILKKFKEPSFLGIKFADFKSIEESSNL